MKPNYANEHHKALVENINWNIQHMKELHPEYSAGKVSDGHHTFNELYDYRAHLLAALCRAYPGKCWKSLNHSDEDETPMFDGMFIICIETPKGPVRGHYDIDPYWDLFKVEARQQADLWDGATREQEIERLDSLVLAKSVGDIVKDIPDAVRDRITKTLNGDI